MIYFMVDETYLFISGRTRIRSSFRLVGQHCRECQSRLSLVGEKLTSVYHALKELDRRLMIREDFMSCDAT